MNDIRTTSQIPKTSAVSVFSRDAIRYFAIVCMTFDHVAWFFFDFMTLAAQIMHFFGRMTAPIMCFFVAEGFHYTKNLKKYFTRLIIFGCVSQIPFYLLGINELNMIFTLTLSLAAICVFELKTLHPILRALIILALVAVCHFADWDVFGILWVLGFHIFRDSRLKKSLSFVVVWLAYLVYAVYINVTSYGITGVRDNVIYSLYVFGSLVSLLLILFVYNGKKGRFNFTKWIIYSYYPLHLMVIWVISEYFIE